MAQLYGRKDGYIAGNIHFNSFKVQAEIASLIPVDLVIEEDRTTNALNYPFKGNLDTKKLQVPIDQKEKEII